MYTRHEKILMVPLSRFTVHIALVIMSSHRSRHHRVDLSSRNMVAAGPPPACMFTINFLIHCHCTHQNLFKSYITREKLITTRDNLSHFAGSLLPPFQLDFTGGNIFIPAVSDHLGRTGQILSGKNQTLANSTVEPVLGDLWFGRPLVLGDHNHWHGSFLTIQYLA